jgi:hypothetical protein
MTIDEHYIYTPKPDNYDRVETKPCYLCWAVAAFFLCAVAAVPYAMDWIIDAGWL